MKEFEVLDHTSELKIKARGKTPEKLFRNMMRGMSYAMQPRYDEIGGSVVRELVIDSQNIDTLLVDFLSEVLYLSQVEKEVYGEVEFLQFSETTLEAKLFGKKVSSTGEDIKAVTYHGAEIHKASDGFFEVEVIYDI